MRRQVFPTAPSPTVTHFINFDVDVVDVVALALLAIWVSYSEKIKQPTKSSLSLFVLFFQGKFKAYLWEKSWFFFPSPFQFIQRESSKEKDKERGLRKIFSKVFPFLMGQRKDIMINENHFNLSCQRGKKSKEEEAHHIHVLKNKNKNKKIGKNIKTKINLLRAYTVCGVQPPIHFAAHFGLSFFFLA